MAKRLTLNSVITSANHQRNANRREMQKLVKRVGQVFEPYKGRLDAQYANCTVAPDIMRVPISMPVSNLFLSERIGSERYTRAAIKPEKGRLLFYPLREGQELFSISVHQDVSRTLNQLGNQFIAIWKENILLENIIFFCQNCKTAITDFLRSLDSSLHALLNAQFSAKTNDVRRAAKTAALVIREKQKAARELE